MSNGRYTIFCPTYTDRPTGTTRRSNRFHIRFRDHLARRQTIAGERSEQATHRVAESIVQLIDCRRQLISPDPRLQRWIELQPAARRQRLTSMDLVDAAELTADRAVLDYLSGRDGIDPTGDDSFVSFERELRGRGVTPKHVSNVIRNVRSVLEGTGVSTIKDLVAPVLPSRVRVWLGTRRSTGQITGTTYNYIIRDLKCFLRWLQGQGVIDRCTLLYLRGIDNTQTDKIVRRSISVDELGDLCRSVLSTDRRHHGLSAKERVLLYRFAFATGLRPSSIRSFRVGSFTLGGSAAFVTTEATKNKRRVTHHQPIPSALVPELRKRLRGRRPEQLAFLLPSDPAEMLRHDLQSAREAWIRSARSKAERAARQNSDYLCVINHRGERATFYSLRHAFGTALAEAGVPQKDIAAAMHHTTTRMTERYLHSSKDRIAEAVQRLPIPTARAS